MSTSQEDEAGSISRRAFLGATAAAVAVVVVPLATAGQAAAAPAGSLKGLSRDSFVPLVNQSFTMVGSAGRSLPVVLSQIGDLTTGPAGSETRFSLTFDGPLTPAWPQSTYRFQQAQLGAVTLFAVPVGRSVQVQQYEAILFLG